MKDFKKIAMSLIQGEKLHQVIKNELYQTTCGIIDGDIVVNCWESAFYLNLVKDGYIKLTKYGEKYIELTT